MGFQDEIYMGMQFPDLLVIVLCDLQFHCEMRSYCKQEFSGFLSVLPVKYPHAHWVTGLRDKSSVDSPQK